MRKLSYFLTYPTLVDEILYLALERSFAENFTNAVGGYGQVVERSPQ